MPRTVSRPYQYNKRLLFFGWQLWGNLNIDIHWPLIETLMQGQTSTWEASYLKFGTAILETSELFQFLWIGPKVIFALSRAGKFSLYRNVTEIVKTVRWFNKIRRRIYSFRLHFLFFFFQRKLLSSVLQTNGLIISLCRRIKIPFLRQRLKAEFRKDFVP